MSNNYHSLLKRQIKKHIFGGQRLPPQYDSFLSAINLTYFQIDEERRMIERSLDISSRELQQKNTEIQAMINVFPDAIMRVNTVGKIVDFHPPANLNDFRFPEGMIGKNIQDIFGPVIGKKYKEAIDQVAKSQEKITIEYWQIQQNQRFYFESRLQALQNDQIIVIIREFTDYVRTLEALRRSEQRYALSAAGANDGLWDWDLINDKLYLSARWKTMLGYQEDELGESSRTWFDLIHPADFNLVKKAIESHKLQATPHLEVEYQIKHKDGSYIWALTRGIAVSDNQGNVIRIAGSQTDITARKVVEEQLRHDALHDKLTSLPNRVLFMDRLSNSIERAKRHRDYTFAILFIDLDRFKIVNDSLGHLVGDDLLVTISERLFDSIRTIDTVARLGGDEFTILLDDVKDAKEAIYVSERIQQKIAEPININGQEIYVSASIGITLSSENTQKPEELLRDADTAMYRAKNQGKAGHEVFDQRMHVWAMERLDLESSMRRAVEREEFEVYYQPIISLTENKIVRLEALLRWNHPKRGLVYPADFIPIAEETGLIIPIGEWVMEQVCHQSIVWHSQGYPDLDLAVNFSARQFEHKELTAYIEDMIKKTGVNAFTLEIEITESIAMKNVDYSIKVLNKLKDMGLKVAIDDFGVGYSSFSCLKYFPIDALKIDQTFIKDIPENKDSIAITKAMIGLGHSLDLNVIAEGVEQKSQLEFLKENKCDAIQGFYIAKPMNKTKTAQFLKDYQT